ncbi:hypothetical protein L226DRAFT_567567 [Lentinus tigrinus ALCF2SS1-7]|uniref:uncharacterized protein n=1 Tax=Lentinus tigrinus ALCF2SS1-7 TaxID=1328758 RepID=UPI001165E9A6|nr:hypothetical protein L226DRAFT_567567 [Lentinus tigrinus ALCF2SS1-7]
MPAEAHGTVAAVLAAVSQATVHHARQTQINHYAAFSRLALLAYDVLINLAREKRLVWDEKFRPSSVLYYMTRYPVVAYQIFNVVYTPSTPQSLSPSSCDALDKFTWFISLVLTRFAICASFILRVYAVMPQDILGMLLAIVLGLIGVLIIALDIWQDVEASCTQASNPLCTSPRAYLHAIYAYPATAPATVLTFLSLIFFDVFTTAILTWRMASMIHFGGGLKSLNSQKITKLFVQSGVVYFATITGLQLGGVILYFLPQGVYSTVLNNYTLLLSSILVSHFLLNLRQLVYDGDPDVTTTAMQSMSFAPSPNDSDHAKIHARTLMDEFSVPSYSYFFEATDRSSGMEMQTGAALERPDEVQRNVVSTDV